MTRCLVAVAIGSISIGCAEPVQRGGLGVFNPRGLEGRLALANRATGEHQARPEAAPTAAAKSGNPDKRAAQPGAR